MRRIIQLTFVLLILSGCASKTKIIETSPAQPNEIIKFGKSKKIIKNGISVVYLSGSPYEIGLGHGRLCKEEILQTHEYYFWLYDNRDTIKFMQGWMTTAREVEKHIPEEYLEEMRGISEGSGISYDKILFINSLTTVSRRNGCFAFAYKDKNLKIHILRQIDLSLKQKLWKKMILFVVKPQNGNMHAAFLNPGWIDGETGMNDKGLYISQNAIHIGQSKWNIMPITHLTRYILQYADTINDVDKILDEQEAFPVKLLFVASKESAAVFEIANDEKARIDMESRFLALSNHARLLPSRRILNNSQKRLNYANNYLKENIGSMNMDKALKLVKSSRISSFWRNGAQNRQSFFFSPGTLDFFIALPPKSKIEPASHNSYVKFNLLDELRIFEN